jgi:arginine-tRNA-protein transferase
MDAGFRRSGKVIYQPTCRGCRQCVSLRVLVDRFKPNKSQRRCARRNVDLIIEQGEPTATDEKFELYRRYVTRWHARNTAATLDSANDREAFESFLYDSPVDTIEFTYRDQSKRLLAVGICDRARLSLSSVYFYFDPADGRRSLGTFGAIHELSVARALAIPFYYLGFWVRGCSAMAYKANFRPHQVLLPDGRWCDGATNCDILAGDDETVIIAR